MSDKHSGASALPSWVIAAGGRKMLAWAAATVIAWTLTITAGVRHLVPPELHGVVDAGTASLTILTGGWLIARHFSKPRLQPGERIISDDEMSRIMEAVTKGAVAGLRACQKRDGQVPGLSKVS